MGASFPRKHHALYQAATASRRPGRAGRHGPPGNRVAYLADPMHTFSWVRGCARTAIKSGELMGVRVAVAGASGYAGGELLRIIAGHPGLEPGPLAAAASAGTPVTAVHPHLAEFAGQAFEPLDPARLSAADVVFL